MSGADKHLDAYEVFLIKILFHARCADNVEQSDRSRSARVLHDEGSGGQLELLDDSRGTENENQKSSLTSS